MSPTEMLSREEEAKQTLWRADACCLDVDSTLCTDEGLDELAAFLGVRAAVAALTDSAMDGRLSFADSLARRLQLMRPTRAQVDAFAARRQPPLAHGARELVAALNQRGVDVYLLSGGLRQLVEPVAVALGVSRRNVYANELRFDDEGNFAGFDQANPMATDAGKADVCRQLKSVEGYERLVHVGDGATDAATAASADAFIAFVGVRERPAVRAAAAFAVASFADLLALLDTDVNNN